MPTNTSSAIDLLKEAREAEANNDMDSAIKLYQRVIRKQPHLEEAYNRLMVIFRKEKDYEAEFDVISQGIKAFEDFYKQRAEKVLHDHKQAQRLSSALARSLGQSGKKTSAIFYPQPIPRWLKRQEVVEKKLQRK
jgi:tetratricopeptide (TPR) repeat protein